MTMLSWSDMCQMSFVNWEMKSRWLNWRFEHLSLYWCKAKVNVL